MKHLTIGILVGITLTISTHAATRTRLGRHTLRWIWYTDARHTHPAIYSWKALA